MRAEISGLVVPFVVAAAVAGSAWAMLGIATTALARYRAAFTERTRFDLREMFLFVDPERVFALNLAASVLAACVAWLVVQSVLVAGLVGGAAALAPRLAFGLLKRRRLRRLDGQWPDMLMVLAGSLRAGLPLAAGLQQVAQELRAPLGQELTLMLKEQRLGLALDESLENLHRRVPIASTTLVVSAMRIASETGGGLAETLERVAQTLRSQHAMDAKIRALTAQGKLQSWIVGLLPVLLGLVLAWLEPAATSLLWRTEMGVATLTVIGLLEGIGFWLIRRIVTIDV